MIVTFFYFHLLYLSPSAKMILVCSIYHRVALQPYAMIFIAFGESFVMLKRLDIATAMLSHPSIPANRTYSAERINIIA